MRTDKISSSDEVPTRIPSKVSRIVNFVDVDQGLESESTFTLDEMFSDPITVVTKVYSESGNPIIAEEANAAVVRRQCFEAVLLQLNALIKPGAFESWCNRLAMLKQEVELGSSKLSRNSWIKSIEGNSAEVLRCLKDAVSAETAETFRRPHVVMDLRRAIEVLRDQHSVEPCDVKEFRSLLRQHGLMKNAMLERLLAVANKHQVKTPAE